MNKARIYASKPKRYRELTYFFLIHSFEFRGVKFFSMNLYNYLSTVNRLWNNEDGTGVSRFITLSGNHASNPNLHIENPDTAVERALVSPLDEVVSSHLKVLFYLYENRKKHAVVQCETSTY